MTEPQPPQYPQSPQYPISHPSRRRAAAIPAAIRRHHRSRMRAHAPPPIGPKNGLGIAALIVAIIGLVFCWTVFGGIMLGLVAVIIGFVARGRVKRGEATNGGVAVAGIVLGILAIVLGLVFIPIWYGVFHEVGGTDYVDCLSKAGSDQHAVQQCADQFRDRVQDKFSVTLTTTAPATP